MPRKIKDINRLIEKIESGKGTVWDLKNLGSQCQEFKKHDMYDFLKYESNKIINTNLDATPKSGALQDNYAFQSGYLAGVRSLFLAIDDRIAAMNETYEKEKHINKVEQEDELPDEIISMPTSELNII
jgi:hypothetical protein